MDGQLIHRGDLNGSGVKMPPTFPVTRAVRQKDRDNAHRTPHMSQTLPYGLSMPVPQWVFLCINPS
jgi:hypothetical protein